MQKNEILYQQNKQEKTLYALYCFPCLSSFCLSLTQEEKSAVTWQA